jgi:hypothetical protein
VNSTRLHKKLCIGVRRAEIWRKGNGGKQSREGNNMKIRRK